MEGGLLGLWINYPYFVLIAVDSGLKALKPIGVLLACTIFACSCLNESIRESSAKHCTNKQQPSGVLVPSQEFYITLSTQSNKVRELQLVRKYEINFVYPYTGLSSGSLILTL